MRRKKKRKKHTSNGLQKFPHLAWEVLERYTTQVNPTSSNNSNYMNGKRKISKWLLITLRMKIWVLKKYKSINKTGIIIWTTLYRYILTKHFHEESS